MGRKLQRLVVSTTVLVLLAGLWPEVPRLVGSAAGLVWAYGSGEDAPGEGGDGPGGGGDAGSSGSSDTGDSGESGDSGDSGGSDDGDGGGEAGGDD